MENEQQSATTMIKFRELTATLRSHFRAGNCSDLSDEALLSFSSVALPKDFAVLRNALDYRSQLDLARRSIEEYAYFPHNNLSALGQSVSRETYLKKREVLYQFAPSPNNEY